MTRLDAPLTLPCGLVLPNRMSLAPLTNRQSHSDGRLSEAEARWLIARAEGGFGQVSTCATYVSEEGKAWEGQLGLSDDDHVAPMRALAAAIRELGAVPTVQLHHAGKKASLAPDQRLSTVDGEGVRGASEADLQRVIADYVSAARRAEAAGFGGVEVHGANGYLFTQFLSPVDNPRTDAWGGTLEGRARLLRAAVRAVRAAVSPGFAVGVRMSPVDTWDRRGLVVHESAQVAAWLAQDGADFIHLSLRDAAAPPPFEDSDVPVVTTVREALPSEVALLVAGGIASRADAERAVDLGADVVVIGKAAIRHADWPRASREPGWSAEPPPWSAEDLRANAVSDAFLDYMRSFPRSLVAAED